MPLWLIPTAWAARGTPLGTPFADDFDFLHFSLLRGNPSWFDGGGGGLYWRPLARQLDYGLLGPVMLEHPAMIAVLHGLALALAGLALYAAVRHALGRPAAACAAATPLLLDGSRLVLAWPSCAQELGALLMLALALLSVARRQWVLAALAAAAAVLCKETAAAAVPLLALAPLPALAPRRRRGVVLMAAFGLLGVWWTVHRWVEAHAGQFPISVVAPPEAASTSAAARIVWSLMRAFRDTLNVDLLSVGLQRFFVAAALVLVAAAAGAALLDRAANQRLARRLPWILWGLAWFALTAAPSASLYPAWASYRSLLPALGLGVALTAMLAALPVYALAPLVALRLAALIVAPGAPTRVAEGWSDFGAAFDFPRLARVQRFVAETHRVLAEDRRSLPRGAMLAKHAWPRMTEYAFAGGKAFQVWYRDTTLRWVSFEKFRLDRSLPVSVILEYQPLRRSPISCLSPEAMRELLNAVDRLQAGEYQQGLERLAAAERLEPDTSNAVFLASVDSRRALAFEALGRSADAAAAAARAFARYPDDPDARVVLARAAERRGDRRLAARLLEEHLLRYPGDATARERLEALGRASSSR